MVKDRNELSNAIAINSSIANGARLIGPAIAGWVIGAVGEGWCFLIDGVSYLAVIASLLLMRIEPQPLAEKRKQCSNKSAKVGIYAFLASHPHHPSAFCADQTGALRNWCGDLGSLAGTPKVRGGADPHASDRRCHARPGVDCFGLSHTLWLSSLVLMVFVGFGMIQVASVSNTIIQSLVTVGRRARTGNLSLPQHAAISERFTVHGHQLRLSNL